MSRDQQVANDPDVRSLLRAELRKIAELFDAADRRAKNAVTLTDRGVAEAERLEAEGDFYACETQLAHLFLMLVRITLRHERDALLLYLTDALRPELEALANLILEARK